MADVKWLVPLEKQKHALFISAIAAAVTADYKSTSSAMGKL